MLELKAELRTESGHKLAAKRAAGLLPVVVYGRKDKPQSLFVTAADFSRVFKVAGESTLISLKVGPKEERVVLVHEVARHPLTTEPIHADFYAVDQKEEVELEVPLNYIGLAPAIKELGGVLVKVLRELTISALPKDLPHEIEVDTSVLVGLDSQILVRDLKLPAGVAARNKPEEVVAAITTVTEEKEEAAPVDLSQIEVEKKGKKEEEGEAAAEGEAPVAEK